MMTGESTPEPFLIHDCHRTAGADTDAGVFVEGTTATSCWYCLVCITLNNFSIILAASGYSTVAFQTWISLTVRLKRLVNKRHRTDIKYDSDDDSQPIQMSIIVCWPQR